MGLSELHGFELVTPDEDLPGRKLAKLDWQDVGGFRAAPDAHLALARALKKRKSERKASFLGDGLARWGALLKDPAFTSYVQTEIESLGDDLVGKDDVDTIVYAVSSALSDIVGGEARLQMSRGSAKPVFELTKLALRSGLDPVFWTSSFKPLRVAFQAELAELDVLLQGEPRVNDVELYLSQLEAQVSPWAKVRDSGVLGLDLAVDNAVITAVETLRRLDHPAIVLDRVTELLERAGTIARSESTQERARECSKAFQRYRGSLCNYCSKRDANPETSVVLQGKRVLSSERVGYNTIRTTYRTMAGLIPRCATCAELHEWLYHLVRTVWLSIGVSAMFAFWVLGTRVGFGGVFLGAVLLVSAGYAGLRLVAMLVTARGDKGYWAYKRTEGYQPFAREGYDITAHDYSKSAFARLRKQGPRNTNR